MKKLNLKIFLNKFYEDFKLINKNKKLISKLKVIYGLNNYSCIQICILLGLKYNLNTKFLLISDWNNFYFNLKENFNFFLFELKLKNIKRIRSLRTYKSWRHIFNLPTRGQRSHTNAKTRKRFKIV